MMTKLKTSILLLLFCICTITLCVAQIPTNPIVTSITSSTATFSWNAVTGATSYRVKWTSDAVWDSIATPATNSYVATGLVPNKAYRYVVRVQTPTRSSYTAEIPFTTLPSSAGGITPTFDHIVILIEENHGYTQIVGNPSAPNFNALINGTQSALFTQSYGLTHPSEPNYLMLFSGANQGVTNDACPVGPFTTGNIFQQLGSIGKSYIAYSRSLPSVGSTVCSNGYYQRKHAPWTNWSNVNHNNEIPFTSLSTDYTTLPYLTFIVPDQLYDWHDGTLAQMDTWIAQSGVANYATWAKTHNSLLIVTFDEDDGSTNNRIATVFVGAKVTKGSYSQTINHYSILRLLEDMNSLSTLGGAATASQINFCWSSARISDIENPVLTPEPIFNINRAVFYNVQGVQLNVKYEDLPYNQIIIARDNLYPQLNKKIIKIESK